MYERLRIEATRLAELESELEPLRRQLTTLEGLTDVEIQEGDLAPLEAHVARLEQGRRRRIEDELAAFNEREVLPRIDVERRSGLERRSGMDRRRSSADS